MDGWMDGWMDGKEDGETEGNTKISERQGTVTIVYRMYHTPRAHEPNIR
jgi:hypothetical protein